MMKFYYGLPAVLLSTVVVLVHSQVAVALTAPDVINTIAKGFTFTAD